MRKNVCVCVCVCVCVYVCVRVRVRVCVYKNEYASTRVCVRQYNKPTAVIHLRVGSQY